MPTRLSVRSTRATAVQTVESTDAKKVVTFRTSTFEAAGTGNSAPVEMVDAPAASDLSSWVEDKVAASDRPELTSAGIVVSGGRRARLLGTVRADRKALPTSSAPPSARAVPRSIPATRRTTGRWGRRARSWRPDLYIAVGISGAIQHLAGMKDSKVIVAINKGTKEAPIFQVADYGLVADLFDAVPELTSKL